jgi:hypothetical protein
VNFVKLIVFVKASQEYMFVKALLNDIYIYKEKEKRNRIFSIHEFSFFKMFDFINHIVVINQEPQLRKYNKEFLQFKQN